MKTDQKQDFSLQTLTELSNALSWCRHSVTVITLYDVYYSFEWTQ